MKTLKKHLPALLAISIGMSAGVVHGQVTLFSDDFTTDTSANWTVQPGSGNAINDYTAEFGFNYATNRFIRNGVTNTIPLAPNSTVGVATNGIKITINNNDEVAATAAVNLYPVSQSFSNDYALKFDMWINYNGGEFGGTGSTEFSIFGLNMSGTLDNWTGADLGDGVWFGVTGEGGAARDWRAYVGDAQIPGAPLELLGVSAGFLDRDNDGTPEQESFTDPDTYPLKLLFPRPTYETAAVPGKQWVQVEVRQRTNDTGNHVVTWLVNGYVIAQLSPDQYLQTNGNIMIGAMDIFASIANPREENFFIFDNVRVVDMSGVETVDVSIVATQPGASEPATDGVMTITRTGSTASPLVVPFRTAGSATRGADYVTQTNGVTFTANAITIPAGQASVDITIKTQDDGIGESPEQAYLVLDGKPSAYDIGLNAYAIVEIADDGDTPEVTVTAFRRAAYEGNTNSYGQFRVLFSNPFPAGDVNVNYTLTGTAVNGTHYETIAGAVTITAGLTEAFVTVLPIDNADTVSNRTVILTLGTGTNYKLAATNTNTTVTIFNDDLPAAITSLYSEDFDVDTSTSWSVFFGTTDVTRDRATFAYDYSADGIPAAPRSTGGSTRGLKMEANVISLGSALFSGLSASPSGQNFTGDYRMRFNWWINFPGPLAAGGSGSTQLGTYGITRGTRAQWPGSAAGSDSIFFAMSGDGGTNPDIRAYTNGGAVLPAGLTYYAAPTLNNTDTYYAVFGNLAAPAAQLQTPFGGAQTGRTSLGAPGLVWHDVVISKLGNTLVWQIDGVAMAQVNAAKVGFNLSTNIFVGHTDINAGQSTLPEMLFSLYDNLVVESLPVPAVTITNITLAGTNTVLTFTGGTNDPAAAYILQQAPIVVGPYTNTLSATITNVSAGVFRAITPVSGDTRFYRILR